MNRLLKGTAAALTLALGFGTAANAAAKAREVPIAPEAQAVEQLERVDSITMMTAPHGWRAVDDNTLIVWATPFRPYLVELAFPSHDLRFSDAIGISQTGSRVHSRFDTVLVRGLRYPISGIYKMTQEEAKSWGKVSS